MYERRKKTMTFKEIAKLLETNIQTIPNLIAILKKGFEEAETGSSVEVTQIQSSGTKIANITVGEESTDIYAPDPSIAYVAAETKIGKFLGNDLYRQVIHLTDAITISASQAADLATIENIAPRNMYVMAYENGIWYKGPTEGLMLNYVTSNGKIQLYATTSWAITEIYLVIEYEKVSE